MAETSNTHHCMQGLDQPLHGLHGHSRPLLGELLLSCQLCVGMCLHGYVQIFTIAYLPLQEQHNEPLNGQLLRRDPGNSCC